MGVQTFRIWNQSSRMVLFLHEQWKLHTPEPKLPLSVADVKYIRELTKDNFVVQGRDHAPDHLHLFYSRFFLAHLTLHIWRCERVCSISSDTGTGQSFFAASVQHRLAEEIRMGSKSECRTPSIISATEAQKELPGSKANNLLSVLCFCTSFPGRKHSHQFDDPGGISQQLWVSNPARNFQHPSQVPSERK